MNCPQCGNVIPPDATDCPYCRAAAQAGNYAGQPATHGMAIASLVLGLVGLFCVPIIGPVLGLIFGIVALNKINGNPGVWKGSGLAIAGIIISGFGVLYLPVLAAILFPVFAKAREKACERTCINNQRQLAISMLSYCQDNDETLPLPSKWVDASGLSSDLKVWTCPSASVPGTTIAPNYGYNGHLYDLVTVYGNTNVAGVTLGELTNPEQIECTMDLKRNYVAEANANTAQLMENGKPIVYSYSYGKEANYCHNGGIVVSYLDGHVKYESYSETGTGKTKYNVQSGNLP